MRSDARKRLEQQAAEKDAPTSYEYQVSVEGPWSRRKTWRFDAPSDDHAIRRAQSYKRMVEKMHNMSVSPNRLLIRDGRVIPPGQAAS